MKGGLSSEIFTLLPGYNADLFPGILLLDLGKPALASSPLRNTGLCFMSDWIFFMTYPLKRGFCFFKMRFFPQRIRPTDSLK